MADKGIGGSVDQTKKRHVHEALQKHRAIVAIAVVLAIALVILVGIYIHQKSKIDCVKLTSESTQLIRQKQYTKAYAKLKPHKEFCADKNRKFSNNNRLEYEFRLAVSAFQAGDHQNGKLYAKNALQIFQSMSSGDRNNVPEAGSLVLDLYDITKYNTYFQVRGWSE